VTARYPAIGRVLAIALAVFADAVRRRTLYVVGVFAAVMLVAIPSLPSYGVGVVQAVYREVSQALVYVAALVLALALTVNRIPSEIERRTVFNVLAKRVARWEYVVGTWLGVFLFMGVAIALFTVVNQVVALFSYRDPMWRLWEGSFAIWLEIGLVAALATAVSTRVGSVPTAIASLAFLFVGHSRDGLMAAGAPRVVGLLYPSLDTFNVINPVAHGHGISAGYAFLMIACFLPYAAVLLALGSALFSKRDL
jgi:ABC-type transport system involved in multi-copper enzyme maturation permease subunit